MNSNPSIPALIGGEVQGFGGEPFVLPYSIDPTGQATSPIRYLDPVVQGAGGTIRRALPTDTAILGFSASSTPPSRGSLYSTEFAMPNLPRDSSGNLVANVYLAAPNTTFYGATSGNTSQSLVQRMFNLAYAVVPAAPTSVTPVGTAGSTTYTYALVYNSTVGTTTQSSTTSTSTGNATLSSTNYNAIVIPAVPFGTTVMVVRTAGGAAQGLIGTVSASQTAATTFNDTGLTATPYTAPTVNDSGFVINTSASTTNIAQVLGLVSTDPLGKLGGRVEFVVPDPASQYATVAGS